MSAASRSFFTGAAAVPPPWRLLSRYRVGLVRSDHRHDSTEISRLGLSLVHRGGAREPGRCPRLVLADVLGELPRLACSGPGCVLAARNLSLNLLQSLAFCFGYAQKNEQETSQANHAVEP